jgi:tRNA A37 threonylcarbamoyladenosine modification protein TsaB
MHLAIGAKIVAVPTLDVIAANTADFQAACGSLLPRVGVILDAKRGRFFAAIYETKPPQTPVASTENAEIVAPAPMRKVLPDALLTAEEFLEMARPDRRPISLLGEGLVYYKNKFAACGVDFLPPEYWNPKASKVHMLGWQRAQHNLFEDPIKFTPAYLSRPDAIVKSRP